MSDHFHGTLTCVGAGHDLVLSLRCAPVCAEGSECFFVPAARLAVGRIIGLVFSFHLAERAANAVRRRALRIGRGLRRASRAVRVRVCAMRL